MMPSVVRFNRKLTYYTIEATGTTSGLPASNSNRLFAIHTGNQGRFTVRNTSLVFHLAWASSCLYALSASAQSDITAHSIDSLAQPEATAATENVAPTLEQVLGQIKMKQTAVGNSASKDGKSREAADTRLLDGQSVSQAGDHSLKALVENAGEFARTEHSDAERVEVSLTPIDRRLRLKRCDEDLSYAWTSANNTMGGTSITARCDGSAPWKVLVRARVQVFHNIPVLSVPVGKGDILTEDVVTSRLLDVSVLRRETLRNIDNVIGYQFKRRVVAGREISSAVLAAPKVVDKGDLVLISASNQVLDVQMKGTALSGGEVGRKIQVRSNSSGRVIQTWIKGPGRVVVSP